MSQMIQTFEGHNLFNASFMGIVLATAIDSHAKVAQKDFSYPLVYLVLPIVLHTETRKALPKSNVRLMHDWIQEHSYLRLSFAERCKDLKMITEDAISFLLAKEVIEINKAGRISIRKSIAPNSKIKFSTEMVSIQKAASRVGEMFAKTGSSATVFTMWGVRP